jgi:hypothetical protein
MKRAVPTLRFFIRKPRSPQAGLSLLDVRQLSPQRPTSGGDPLHDRDGVIRFQHRRKISSILIRNTVMPIAIRTTLGIWRLSRQITENPELL